MDCTPTWILSATVVVKRAPAGVWHADCFRGGVWRTANRNTNRVGSKIEKNWWKSKQNLIYFFFFIKHLRFVLVLVSFFRFHAMPQTGKLPPELIETERWTHRNEKKTEQSSRSLCPCFKTKKYNFWYDKTFFSRRMLVGLAEPRLLHTRHNSRPLQPNYPTPSCCFLSELGAISLPNQEKRWRPTGQWLTR